MKKVFLCIGLVTLMACTPKVRTNVYNQYPQLDFDQNITLLSETDPLPQNVQRIGEVKIKDSGLTVNCNLDVVLNYAKHEARKAGGNLIKITDHQQPGFKSSCHQIEADIYRVLDSEVEDLRNSTASSAYFAESADHALLYVFRPRGSGFAVKYNLHFGDSMIHRVTNNSKDVFEIRKRGLNRIWAKTEVLAEIPIDIEFGKKYYLQCGVSAGLVVGRPTLELLDERAGEMIYNTIEP